ncbi:MAG: succinate--CoA ligase subunit alpha [Candidatus Kariarchaeum pelagius]|jgi:succinyl-CoA synthetase alpha subunit|nr:succinate--CoA ligase subunit alpha [Candidatus Heimdallarchaeota archaeon]
MAVLLDKNTKVLVQGITGYQGLYHAKLMKNYGTDVVGGTRPGKGGEMVDGFPIFDSVLEAVHQTGANASVIFVPAKFTKLAAFEAIDAGIELLVIVTEGVPVVDTMEIINRAKNSNTIVVGPNCPGLMTPGEAKIGIIPGDIVKSGNIGVVSRSGTLTYEVAHQLNNSNLGVSTIFGIGGDPIKQTNFKEVLQLFNDDSSTEKIVLIGEIGGDAEEIAAEYIKNNVQKPVIAFIAGKTAKEGKTMGHAGAIVQGDVGTAEGKIKALSEAGAKIADKLSDIPNLLK